MTRTQFASGRSQLPWLSGYLSTAATSTRSTAKTLWISIAGENSAGVSLLASPIQVTVPANKKLTVTLPGGYKLAGEYWQRYTIAASTTNTLSTFVQIGKIKATDTSIAFDTDEDFSLSKIIADPSLLPSVPVHGQLRSISSLSSNVFEYQKTAILTANGTSVLSSPDGGVWVYRPGNFSAYVASTTDAGGCDRAANLVVSTLLNTPVYDPASPTSADTTYWIVNTDATPIASGKRVGVAIAVDGIVDNSTYDSLISVRFQGYSDINAGTRRTIDTTSTAFPNLDTLQTYTTAKSGLILPDALNQNEAYTIALSPSFSTSAGAIADTGGTLSAYPFFYDQINNYNAAAGAYGDRMYARYEVGTVLPLAGLSARVGKRAGIVGNYEFEAPAVTVSGLTTNALQRLIINGNGAIAAQPSSYTPSASEAIRAIVSTESGYTAPTAYQSITVSGSQSVNVAIGYPSTGATATIRANYPDRIAGSSGVAKFNAPFVSVFLRSSGVIKRFDGFAVADAASQTFNISNWSLGTIVSALPTVAANFGLFAPTTVTPAAAASGNLPTGTIDVAVSFNYDGSAITKISHAAIDGCIFEATFTQAQIENSAKSWGAPVASTAIVNIPQVETFPYQVRSVIGLGEGDEIYWNAASTATVDNVKYWLPTWNTGAGRWTLRDRKNPVFVGTIDPTGAIGETGNVYLQQSSPLLKIWQKQNASTWAIATTFTPPAGAAGQSAYTTTTTSFTVPAAAASVTIAVVSSDWMAIGMVVFIESAGYYSVAAIGSTTAITVQNLGYTGNAAAAATIATGRKVSSGGVQGSGGSGGSGGAQDNYLFNQTSVAPTTIASQSALYADTTGKLQLRDQSSGSSHAIALLDKAQLYSANQSVSSVTIATASTVTLDLSLSNSFAITLAANTTIANPTNLINGAEYTLRIKQTGAGSYAVAFGTAWLFTATAPTLSAAANTLWVVRAHCDGTNMLVDKVTSFTVAAGITQRGYWACDAIVNGFVVDSLTVTNFQLTGGWRISTFSGSVNGALESFSNGSNNSYAVSSSSSTFYTVGGSTKWKIEFNLKLSSFTPQGSSADFVLLDTFQQWEISIDATSHKLKFLNWGSISTDTVLVHTTVLTTATLYSISCEVAPDLGVTKVTINGATQTTAIVETLNTVGSNGIELGHQNFARLAPYNTFFDEIKYYRA